MPVVILIALDLWTKAAVFDFLVTTLGPVGSLRGEQYPVWKGTVSFSLVRWYNTGTIWGLFPDFNTPLVVLRVGAVLGLAWYVRRLEAGTRFLQFVLGLICAGALGNLYDNLTVAVAGHEGGVRDFLLFFVPDAAGGIWWGFPAFNIADSCITVGVLLLLVSLWRTDHAS